MWLHEKVNSGEILFMKAKGEGNLADGLIRAFECPGTKKHVLLMGQEIVVGRHLLTRNERNSGDGVCDI